MSPFRAIALLAAALAVAGLVIAFTATNNVQPSNAGSWNSAETANDLKPPQCTMTITGFGGSGGNELILGTAGADNLKGGGGSDCLVGGAGNDKLNGGPGTDICIGGPGTDTFVGCETQIQ